MNVSPARQRILGAMLLTSTVVLLCSARSPLAPRSFGAKHVRSTRISAPVASREARAVRIFEKHRLALRDSVVRLALAQVGTAYRFGGTTPEHGFDCSGLIRYVVSKVYLTPPRTAARQARTGAAIRRDGLRPGDILAFGIGDSVTHVGIYVGDRRFVHASSVAGRVIVSRIDRPPSDLIRPFKGARRLLVAPESAPY